jgi:hypothetical protein
MEAPPSTELCLHMARTLARRLRKILSVMKYVFSHLVVVSHGAGTSSCTL